MVTRAARIVWMLTRFDTCALVFLSVFLPTFYQTHDLHFSLAHSTPVLTICMCGFVLNDLSDIEKDRENHPARPLPSNAIGEVTASVLYFSLLGISLIAIKLYVSGSDVYLYVLLLIALVNYNYVVFYLPLAKNIYVAVMGLIPIFILGSLLDNNQGVGLVAPSLFLFLLGREVLLDVQDAGGDKGTLAKAIGLRSAENIAFALKLIGSLWLFAVTRGKLDFAVASSFVLLDVIFVVMWKMHRFRRPIIHLMKLQLLVGIYYLVR